MEYNYDEFLICTVREADPEDKKFLEDYVRSQEASGKRIYYPARDTNQVDETGGYRICSDNNQAIRDSREISVYWTTKSQGTKFDLGMAFNEHRINGKSIRLVNRSTVEQLVEEQKTKGLKKSFEMVLLKLDDLAKE
jgi:hypothetical protein